jgi:hypothetical protein
LLLANDEIVASREGDPAKLPARDPDEAALDAHSSPRLGDMRLRTGGLAWPPVALALLLGTTVLFGKGKVWGLEAPVFVALLVVAAVGGWLVGLIVERFSSSHSGSTEADLQHAGGEASWASRSVRVIPIIAAAAVVGAWVMYVGRDNEAPGLDIRLGVIAGTAFAAGGGARFWFGSQSVVTQLVIAAALAAWAYNDAGDVPFLPFRDLGLYLDAGAAWLDGRAVYLAEPLTVAPSFSGLPFVYPPFVLPFFGALSRLPEGLAIALWEALAVAAVIVALKLLGIRTRWIVPLLLWPPIAVGLSVGNAAPFGLVALAAGWRWGAALVLGGVFKPQTAIPALWLFREGRWGSFALGLIGIAALALATLPFTGLSIYGDWLRGLQAFDESIRTFPGLAGGALQRYVPQTLAVAIAVVAAGAALTASGRMGLSRFGIVAIVASPTLYVHGLAFLLPAALSLDTVSFWLVLGVLPTLMFVEPSGWELWLVIAATFAALVVGLTRGTIARRSSGAGAREYRGPESRLHPLGPSLEPWPERRNL